MKHRKPSTIVRTTRRAVTVGALAVPLTIGGAGLASAGEGGHDHDPYPGASAVQEGGLLGLDLGIDPAANVGGILNSGPVVQENLQADGSNSGIMQTGSGDGGGFDAFDAADLVSAAIDVDPAVNVGGIGNSGPVHMMNRQVDGSNDGIVQSGGGHGGGGTAVDEGGLLGLDASVSPALNIGGILSGGGVYQGNVQHDGSNSGIAQS